jgi:hypothetical protein
MYGHAIQYSYDAAGAKRKVVHQTVTSSLNIPTNIQENSFGYETDKSLD